jgi:hypothetical protein
MVELEWCLLGHGYAADGYARYAAHFRDAEAAASRALRSLAERRLFLAPTATLLAPRGRGRRAADGDEAAGDAACDTAASTGGSDASDAAARPPLDAPLRFAVPLERRTLRALLPRDERRFWRREAARYRDALRSAAALDGDGDDGDADDDDATETRGALRP